MGGPPLTPHARLRWAIVKRIVSELEPATILEIGCGQGGFGARLARRARYLGVEPDPTSFTVARHRIESVGGTVVNTRVEALPAHSEFDLVCAFEVLEHIEDDAQALAAWRAYLKPGGHLLLSTPAWQTRFHHADRLVGHYRRYSPTDLTTLLTDTGYADAKVILYGWPLGYLLEAVRNRLAATRGVAQEEGSNPTTMEARTARSGRLFQPKTVTGAIIHVGVAPFAALQRLRPNTGTSLVCLARRDD
ncbi:MAG: class I SAM-dependent methyltransferase [Acidothermus sp.]|nr:class I SAM-dependent methyltransferase [Acidothermus sp.]